MQEPITVQVAPNVILAFNNDAEVTEFLEKERVKWGALAEMPAKRTHLRKQIIDHQHRALDAIKKELAKGQDRPAAIRHALSYFSEDRNDYAWRALCSAIPADAIALTLAETDPDAALMGMAARARVEDPIFSLEPHKRAYVLLDLIRYAKAADSGEAEEATLDTFQGVIERLVQRWHLNIDQDIQRIAKLEEELKERSNHLAELLKEQRNEHENLRDGHATTMKAIEEKFLKEMVLRGPVQYWSDRASTGRNVALAWLAAFVGSAYFMFTTVRDSGHALLNLLKDDQGQIGLAGAPLLIGALIPMVWGLRQLARLFSDNLADSRDARQRASLTSTFLALTTKEGVTFSDQERAIVIAALFRPSPAQPADDGVPLPVIELLKSKPSGS